MNRTGRTVNALIAQNITRPPNRSVSAPTGMRPSEPTITGTATTRACSNALRVSMSLSSGPSGDSSDHAQKFTAKPTVASASMPSRRRAPEPGRRRAGGRRPGRRGRAAGGRGAGGAVGGGGGGGGGGRAPGAGGQAGPPPAARPPSRRAAAAGPAPDGPKGGDARNVA